MIFHTNFFALNRYNVNDKNSINSRIQSLLSLVDCENRIISNSINVDTIKDYPSLNYDEIDKIIEVERSKSINFLLTALELS